MFLRDLIPIGIALCLFFSGKLTYLELASSYSRLPNFVARISLPRLILNTLFIFTFFPGLIAIMIYGLCWHFEHGLSEPVLISSSSGKNLPSGHYSPWALIILLLSCLYFFVCTFVGIIKSGMKGIKARTKNKK